MQIYIQRERRRESEGERQKTIKQKEIVNKVCNVYRPNYAIKLIHICLPITYLLDINFLNFILSISYFSRFQTFIIDLLKVPANAILYLM